MLGHVVVDSVKQVVRTRTSHPVVGIIGGMGPEATVELLRRIIRRTPAKDDQDHIHVLVESDPKIPSRIAHLIEGTGDDPTAELVRIGQNLEAAGATMLAIPCNTAHAYANAIRRAVGIPLLDMVRLAASRARTVTRGNRVGILASTAVLDSQLFAAALEPLDMRLLVPTHQAEIMGLIRTVKAGGVGDAERRELRRISHQLSAHVDAVLIACTELSVLATDLSLSVPLIDSLDVLTEAIVTAGSLHNT
jgi:aspartate racemase